MPVVVLRSNDCCFLGTHRSLAAAGVPSVPVVFDWQGSGPWYSEHSSKIPVVHTIPNPHEHPERAAEDFVRLGEKLFAEHGERLLVVPTSDTNLMFLLDHWEHFAPFYRAMGGRDFDAPRREVIRKDLVARLFEAGGVSTPVTFPCRREEELRAVVDGIAMPCVYKPAVKDYGQSFYVQHQGRKAIECRDRAELERRLRDELARGFELVVQEKVEFESVHDEIPAYVYADANHEIRIAATGIKERLQPHPFGTATVLRLSWHPELLPLARAVVRALRWRGHLMIEFIRDLKDGVWKVIEVNGRPWLLHDFYRRCGLNYVGALAEDLAGRSDEWPDLQVPDAATLERSPVHVMLAEAFGEVAQRLGRAPSVRDLQDFLESIPGDRSLALLDPGDPEPGRRELRDLAERHGLDLGPVSAAVARATAGD